MALMVLSGSRRVSNLESIMNQNTGGGDKKAGIPPTANIPDSVYNAYVENGNGIMTLMNMRKNRFKTPPSQYLPLNITNVRGGRIFHRP